MVSSTNNSRRLFSSTMLFVVFSILVCSIGPIVSQRHIKTGIFEAFEVCNDNSVKMYMWRNYGVGLWNSSVEIHSWPKLSEIRLSLSLNAPATNIVLWKVKNYQVQADDGNRTFHITTSRAENNQNDVLMTVYFDPKLFPNVEQLKIFGIDACMDPLQVAILKTRKTKTHDQIFFKYISLSSDDITGRRLVSRIRSETSENKSMWKTRDRT